MKKLLSLAVILVFLLSAVSCGKSVEVDLNYDFEATDGTYTIYASGETSSSPQIYTFRLFKGNTEVSEPLTLQTEGDRYDDFRTNWRRNVSGDEPMPLEFELSGSKAVLRSATETVSIDFEARTTSISQVFSPENFKEFSKSPDGTYSLGTYETPLVLFCLVRNNDTLDLCYLSVFGSEKAGNDAFFWEGNHDLYRMFDHSVIAYDVERALTVSSPYSIALEDQLRYMAVDVNAEEGVCAILFELVGYDEMFISIYDSNRLMLDCVNTHLKRPGGIDAFQQALAVTITDGTVKVTVDGKTAFTYDYK